MYCCDQIIIHEMMIYWDIQNEHDDEFLLGIWYSYVTSFCAAEFKVVAIVATVSYNTNIMVVGSNQ